MNVFFLLLRKRTNKRTRTKKTSGLFVFLRTQRVGGCLKDIVCGHPVWHFVVFVFVFVFRFKEQGNKEMYLSIDQEMMLDLFYFIFFFFLRKSNISIKLNYTTWQSNSFEEHGFLRERCVEMGDNS